MESWERICAGMKDAGCRPAAIARAEAFYRAGAVRELIGCLRSCRCEQLEALHERQRQLDRLSDLIRRTQETV